MVTGNRESAACLSGATCVLATLSWEVLRSGSSSLALEEAELLGAGGAQLQFGTSGGSVTGALASTVPSFAAGPEATGPNENLDLANAVVGVTVLLLGAGALGAPMLAVHSRRRRESKLEPRRRDPALEQIADTLAGAVTGYLATYESAGRIDDSIDQLYEQIAWQGQPPSSHEQAGETHQALTMLPRTAASREE